MNTTDTVAGDEPADDLQGRLVREPVDIGSKSERLALQLRLPDGRCVPLRRAGAHPFRDPEFEALEGQFLRVEGRMRTSYFMVRHFTVQSAAQSTMNP